MTRSIARNRKTSSKAASPALGAKIGVALLLLLAIVGLSLFLELGRQNGLVSRPGFLGTRARLFADLNLAAQYILLAGLSLGVVLVRRGHVTAHQYMQTSMVLLNLVLAWFIMINSFSRNVVPGLPEILQTAYGLVAGLHAAVGGLAILCGTYLILRMNRILPARLRISGWKNLMRATFGLYWLAGLLGLGLYWVWYIR